MMKWINLGMFYHLPSKCYPKKIIDWLIYSDISGPSGILQETRKCIDSLNLLLNVNRYM